MLHIINRRNLNDLIKLTALVFNLRIGESKSVFSFATILTSCLSKTIILYIFKSSYFVCFFILYNILKDDNRIGNNNNNLVQ